MSTSITMTLWQSFLRISSKRDSRWLVRLENMVEILLEENKVFCNSRKRGWNLTRPFEIDNTDEIRLEIFSVSNSAYFKRFEIACCFGGNGVLINTCILFMIIFLLENFVIYEKRCTIHMVYFMSDLAVRAQKWRLLLVEFFFDFDGKRWFLCANFFDFFDFS